MGINGGVEYQIAFYEDAKDHELFKGTLKDWNQTSEVDKEKIKIKLHEMKEKKENKYINIWKEIEGTPLCTIYSESEKRYRIAIGKYVIDENTYATIEAAVESTKDITWGKIMNFMMAIIDHKNKEQNNREL